MASTQEIQAGRAYVRLFLKNDMSSQLVRALRNAQAKLRNFSRSALSAGRQIAIAGALAAAPFAFATRTFAQFDDAMREVGAVTQAVGADFDMLTDKAKKLGASTSFTAIEVGLLMAELGRANFVPKQIDKMTGSVLALARATKTEGALAAGIMATAIRQFSLEADDASRVADVLTVGANKSFNTLETLGESLKFVGPVAKDFNMSLEDTVAIIGTLGNVGIQGSMAGTTMRRILLATGAEAKRLKKIFGVEFVDIHGNVRPLVDTLQDIADATRHLGSAARAEKFKDAFGLRGITGASAIGRNITGTRELRDAIGEAGGVAKKTADDMDAGLGGAARILKSALEGVQIAIGESLAPTLQKLAKLITKTLQSSIKWIEVNKGVIVALAATVAGVIALGVALMGVGAVAYLAASAFGGLITSISFILSPVGLITAAVVGAAVAFFRWTEAGQSAWRSLSSTLGKLLDRFREVFGGIGNAIRSGNFALAFDIMKAAASLAFAEIAARAKYVFMTLIPGLAMAAFSGLAGAWGAAVGSWKGPVLALWSFFKVVAGAALQFVGVVLLTSLQTWGRWFGSLWKLFGAAAVVTLKLIGVGFKSQMQLAVDIGQALWEAFKGFGLASVQSVVAGFIKGLIIIPAFLVKTLAKAFFQASKFLLKSLIGAVVLWAKFTQKVAIGIGKAMAAALRGAVPTAIKGVDAGKDVAMTGMQAVSDLQETGVEAALKTQTAIMDAQLAGLTGKSGDFGKVAKGFGADAATAIKDDATRQAIAIRDAAKNQLAPALKTFADEIIQSQLDVAGRLKAAGLDAAKVIAPAAGRLAEATKGMSEEVKAAFLERFQASFAGVKDLKDPAAVSALRDRLAALIAEAAETKGEAFGVVAGAGAGGVGIGAGAGGGGGVAGAPSGVALTATYSAAAARIAGFQAGGGGPEKEMVDGIKDVAKNTKEMTQLQQQWLTGMRVA